MKLVSLSWYIVINFGLMRGSTFLSPIQSAMYSSILLFSGRCRIRPESAKFGLY